MIEEAVKSMRLNNFAHVIITGHTDSVGSESYNQGLSEQRAKAVHDEMISDGIEAQQISIAGRSFHEQLRDTGPGVREPHNRRALIELEE